mmetsp:Transcript_9618/g.20824  ORF Transcript_9618/g.20824 Transcript_9618/m.20824 type:complete len:858 (+) Transcript_9618:181-2754(+)
MPRSNSSKKHQKRRNRRDHCRRQAPLIFGLLAFQSSSPLSPSCSHYIMVADALTFPSFGRNTQPHHRTASASPSRGGSENEKNGAMIRTNNNGRMGDTRMGSSVGQTIDDAASTGLWKRIPSGSNDNDLGSVHSQDQEGRRRGLFHFRGFGTDSIDDDGAPRVAEKSQPQKPTAAAPIAGGRSGKRSAVATVALERPRPNPLAVAWTGVRTGARGIRRGIVGTAVNLNVHVLRIGMNNSAREEGGRRGRQDGVRLDASAASAAPAANNDIATISSGINLRFNGNNANGQKKRSALRVGGAINRRLQRRRASEAAKANRVVGAVSDSAVVAAQMDARAHTVDVEAEVDAWSRMEMAMTRASDDGTAALALKSRSEAGSNPLSFLPLVGNLFEQKKENGVQEEQLMAKAELATNNDEATISSVGGSRAGMAVMTHESVSDRDACSSSSSDSSLTLPFSIPSTIPLPSISIGNLMEMETFAIETPLFPIILPKAWDTAVSSNAASTLDISATMQEAVFTSTTATTATVVEDSASITDSTKPPPHLLEAATLPFLPKSIMESFTGREFDHPETIEALAETGLHMTLANGANPHVAWTAERKTEQFLKQYGNSDSQHVNNIHPEWYASLDASQEVLVWAGEAITPSSDRASNGRYHGAELPLIKTTSIVRQSPKDLAELLMDSEKVKVYNKMSLGRTDVKVFQTGIDTQGGAFGDGESKIVRNLTKPPMVNSIIEFVTCMHARKLCPSDTRILYANGNGSAEDEEESGAMEGYIVVSRAVTGGAWSANGDSNKHQHLGQGETLVRNEILLGVNILKAVPGEPSKTELTSVTHVYSPMIPQMLAKNAGVKGAVDFVRDVRAMP